MRDHRLEGRPASLTTVVLRNRGSLPVEQYRRILRIAAGCSTDRELRALSLDDISMMINYLCGLKGTEDALITLTAEFDRRVQKGEI